MSVSDNILQSLMWNFSIAASLCFLGHGCETVQKKVLNHLIKIGAKLSDQPSSVGKQSQEMSQLVHH